MILSQKKCVGNNFRIGRIEHFNHKKEKGSKKKGKGC